MSSDMKTMAKAQLEAAKISGKNQLASQKEYLAEMARQQQTDQDFQQAVMAKQQGFAFLMQASQGLQALRSEQQQTLLMAFDALYVDIAAPQVTVDVASAYQPGVPQESFLSGVASMVDSGALPSPGDYGGGTAGMGSQSNNDEGLV